MTISDLLSITGAVGGVVVLVLMAAVPLLVALPLSGDRRAATPDIPVLIPAQRVASEAPVSGRTAA